MQREIEGRRMAKKAPSLNPLLSGGYAGAGCTGAVVGGSCEGAKAAPAAVALEAGSAIPGAGPAISGPLIQYISPYFFRGTSYPWNRVELFKSDPDGFNMIRDAWNDPGFCASGPHRQTPEPLYTPIIEH